MKTIAVDRENTIFGDFNFKRELLNLFSLEESRNIFHSARDAYDQLIEDIVKNPPADIEDFEPFDYHKPGYQLNPKEDGDGYYLVVLCAFGTCTALELVRYNDAH